MLRQPLLVALVLFVVAPAAGAPIQVRYQVTGGTQGGSWLGMPGYTANGGAVASGTLTATFYKPIPPGATVTGTYWYGRLDLLTTQGSQIQEDLWIWPPTTTAAYHFGVSPGGALGATRFTTFFSGGFALGATAGGAMNFRLREQAWFSTFRTLRVTGQEILVPEPRPAPLGLAVLLVVALVATAPRALRAVRRA